MFPFIPCGQINSPIGVCVKAPNPVTIADISIIPVKDFKGVNRLKPIKTAETNIVYTLEGCGDLPAIAAHDENGQNYIITAWEISPEELKKLNETGILYLSFVGTQIPPVALLAESPLLPDSEGGADNG